MSYQFLRTTSRTCKPLLPDSAVFRTSHRAACDVFPSTSARTRSFRSSAAAPSEKSNALPEDHSLPSFSLLKEVRNARPAVRYTIYAGLGLMVTVETTFWLNVLKAKFFPSGTEEEKNSAESVLANLREAFAGYKANWMVNYGRYYGGYIWGVGER